MPFQRIIHLKSVKIKKLFFSNYSIEPAAHAMQSVAHTCIYYIYNYSKYNSFAIYSNFMNVQKYLSIMSFPFDFNSFLEVYDYFCPYE